MSATLSPPDPAGPFLTPELRTVWMEHFFGPPDDDEVLLSGRTRADLAEAASFLAAGMRPAEVMAMLFLTAADIDEACKYPGVPPKIPTPMEVAQRMEAIRDSWTEKQRADRLVGYRAEQTWTVPVASGVEE